MVRSVLLSLLPFLLLAAGRPARADQTSGTPPLTYELMINGESFLVEADRQVKLESPEKPGVTYDVALRIALRQRVRLNTLEFQYDWPARVEDDHRKPHRTVRIRHELGFTMLITDLGQPLDDEEQTETLKILKESTVQSLRESRMGDISVSDPPPRKFDGADGHGVIIRYQDREGFDQTCLVYLLTGPTFAGSCVVNYFEIDEGTIVPKVKSTLDSIRAVR